MHPLYICNGKMDCASGKDETNCTQGNVRIIKKITLRDVLIVCTVINVLAVQRLAVLESVTNVAMEPAFLRKMLNVMAYTTATTAVTRRTVVSFYCGNIHKHCVTHQTGL